MTDSSTLRIMVDSRLLKVGEHLRQREQQRLRLTSYSKADYKPGSAGAEMVQLLDAMAKEENLALSELVVLRDDVAAYGRATGRGDSELHIVDEFHAFRSAKTIACGCPDSKHSYAFESIVGGGSAGRDCIHDVRFFVELGNQSYQLLELVHDLLQFWEIFLRYHTTLDLKEFSVAVQTGLLGRVTDTVFHQHVARQLVPVLEPAPVNPSVKVLQGEISQRLEKAAFYLEEREFLRPGLAKYTRITSGDVSNENVKRDMMRIRNVETSFLQEMVHLADSVRKWLDKQDRISELAVMERFRPYRIVANLVNVLKHGVRGRNQDCAVIDLDTLWFLQKGDQLASDDPLLDVMGCVNYEGELFSLTQLIEDIAHLWELFLRHHSQISLIEFQVRLGRILLSRKGLSTYTFPMPTGVEAWAQQEAERRKKLDLK